MAVIFLFAVSGCAPENKGEEQTYIKGYYENTGEDNYAYLTTPFELAPVTEPDHTNIVYGNRIDFDKQSENGKYADKYVSAQNNYTPDLLHKYDVARAPWNKNAYPKIFGGETVIKEENRNYKAYKNGEVIEEGNNFSDVLQHTIKENAGTILIDEGEYELTKSINLFSGVKLYGINRPKIKINFNGNGVNISSCSDVVIGNFVFDCGNLENSGGEGINVSDGSHNISLEYLDIKNVSYNGILFSGEDCVNNVVIGCKIENILGGAGIAFYSTAGTARVEHNFVYRTRHHGIIVSRGGSNCIIKNNTVIETGYYIKDEGDFAHGIALDGSGVVHGRNHLVASNTIINAGLAGIEVADYQHEVVIKNNYIDGTGTFKKQDDYGIYFGGGLTPSEYCIILNNYVVNTNGFGIRVDALKGVTQYVQVVCNVLENIGSDGIKIGTVNEISIYKNVITNVSVTVNKSCGITCVGSTNLSIIKNTIDDNREEVKNYRNLYYINCNNIKLLDNICGRSIIPT